MLSLLCRGRKTTAVEDRHLPRDYCVYGSFAGVKRADCVRADAYNTKLFDFRRSLLQSGTGITSVVDDIGPPIESNVERYDRWRAEHVAVPADRQTAAVEVLLNAGVFDFAPQDAIGLAAKRFGQVSLPMPSTELDIEHDDAYVVFRWDTLLDRTEAECRDADRANTRVYDRRSRGSITTQARIVGAQWARMSDNGPARPPSNVARRAARLRRSVDVSAKLQTDAVVLLHSRGHRAVYDYEPQHAMACAFEEEEQAAPPYVKPIPAASAPLPTAPPPPTEPRSVSPLFDSLYPDPDEFDDEHIV